jgi:hypothetical protein
MNCLGRIFGRKTGPVDESISIPIGSAVEKFFVSYADVAKTKPESLRLLDEIKRGNSLTWVICRPLYFDEKFPYSSAFGAFAVITVEQMKDHKLVFRCIQEMMRNKPCFDFALCMVNDSQTHLYEAGEPLFSIGLSENLHQELKQAISTMDNILSTRV